MQTVIQYAAQCVACPGRWELCVYGHTTGRRKMPSFLWKSYGSPMEYLWKTYGDPMDQHGSNTIATGNQRLSNTLATAVVSQCGIGLSSATWGGAWWLRRMGLGSERDL